MAAVAMAMLDQIRSQSPEAPALRGQGRRPYQLMFNGAGPCAYDVPGTVQRSTESRNVLGASRESFDDILPVHR